MSNSLCSQNRGCSSQGLLYRYITICFLFHFYLFLLLTLHDIQVTFIVQIYYIITIWDTLGLYKTMTIKLLNKPPWLLNYRVCSNTFKIVLKSIIYDYLSECAGYYTILCFAIHWFYF